jgi:hypothetical protein
MFHAVATLTPRERPADHVLHALVSLHRSAWGAFIRSGGNSTEAGLDCDALARAQALCSAKTPEGLRAKASVIRARLMGASVLAMLDDGSDSDIHLIASFAEDALALAGE